MSLLQNTHRQLNTIFIPLYKKLGMKIDQQPQAEKESAEYGACRFVMDGKNIVYREGKITPTKVGHFVTTWKRPDREIVPLDASDEIDFLIVTVSDGDHLGQFVFSRDALIKRGILSSDGRGGKLSFRLYAPWVAPQSTTAKKTQAWQVKHFIQADAITEFLLEE